MSTLYSAVILIISLFLVASANKNGESISNFALSASAVELRRIPKLASDILASDSVIRERRVLPEYLNDDLDSLDSIQKRSRVQSDSDTSANGIFSEVEKPIPKKSGQSSGKSGGYGYPYRRAPTLGPFTKHLSDHDEGESKPAVIPTSIHSRSKIPSMPRMPSMPKMSAADDGDEISKRSDSIKKRQGLPYDDDSSVSAEFSPVSFDYSSYREPKYRNSHDLDFSPRRMYYESRGPYSGRPSYRFPTPKPRPAVSPRDPYLSPSSEPIDGFYPKVKNNGVSTSYSAYGKRDKYYNSIADPVPPPSRTYGEDDDDDFSDTSSEEDDFPVRQGGYMKSPKHPYSEEPDTYSEPDSYSKPDTYSERDPYSGPSPKEPVRAGGDSYDALYNSPITGVTRKRLLEYAGASDLYGGEPDYLKSAATRKTKFGSIQDDYHPYPRSRSYSFADYRSDESRRVPSRAKRQVPQQEPATPKCSSGTALPMCLTDDDYPTDEVKQIVSKNMKYLSQMGNTRLEINKKKLEKNSPEQVEDLKKTPDFCSSRKAHVHPKRAMDVDGIWRIIINTGDVRQGIEVDVCRSAETPCDYVPAAIPTKCVQKFSFVTLVTFNTEENALEEHDFPVPSACACAVGRPMRVHLE